MQFMSISLCRMLATFSCAAALAACGGGGSNTPVIGTAYKAYFVDAPVKGLCYSASPSGLSGTTDAEGGYQFKSGDVISFAIPNNGSCSASSAITIASVTAATPTSTEKNLTHVLSLSNGRRMAEVLNALNVGSTSAMDISNLTISPMQVSRISNYINTGALPADAADNANLLKSIQAAITRPSGATFALPVVPATFNTDVTAHLDTTLSGINTSTYSVTDAIGKLYYQAQSGGTGSSIGILKSSSKMTSIDGYNNQGSSSVVDQVISGMTANKFNIVNGNGTYAVTVVSGDSQKMLYTGVGSGGSNKGSGSVNFLTPITLASVAGKRITFEGSESCNGVATDGVFDFSSNGTVMTSPMFPGLNMSVSTDSSLPGVLKLVNASSGTVIYFGMGAGGTMGATGTTLFYVTPLLNPNGRGATTKPFGSFKIKANPSVVPTCLSAVSDGAMVASVTTVSGTGTTAYHAVDSSSNLLTLNGSVYEGDIISTGNSGQVTIEFSDKSYLQLDKNMTVEIRTAQTNGQTIAQSILANGNLWGRVMTQTGSNSIGTQGLVAGVRG